MAQQFRDHALGGAYPPHMLYHHQFMHTPVNPVPQQAQPARASNVSLSYHGPRSSQQHENGSYSHLHHYPPMHTHAHYDADMIHSLRHLSVGDQPSRETSNYPLAAFQYSSYDEDEDEDVENGFSPDYHHDNDKYLGSIPSAHSNLRSDARPSSLSLATPTHAGRTAHPYTAHDLTPQFEPQASLFAPRTPSHPARPPVMRNSPKPRKSVDLGNGASMGTDHEVRQGMVVNHMVSHATPKHQVQPPPQPYYHSRAFQQYTYDDEDEEEDDDEDGGHLSEGDRDREMDQLVDELTGTRYSPAKRSDPLAISHQPSRVTAGRSMGQAFSSSLTPPFTHDFNSSIFSPPQSDLFRTHYDSIPQYPYDRSFHPSEYHNAHFATDTHQHSATPLTWMPPRQTPYTNGNVRVYHHPHLSQSSSPEDNNYLPADYHVPIQEANPMPPRPQHSAPQTSLFPTASLRPTPIYSNTSVAPRAVNPPTQPIELQVTSAHTTPTGTPQSSPLFLPQALSTSHPYPHGYPWMHTESGSDLPLLPSSSIFSPAYMLPPASGVAPVSLGALQEMGHDLDEQETDESPDVDDTPSQEAPPPGTDLVGTVQNKDVKRADLTESPNSKQTYKQFFKQFKNKEREGFKDAKHFALDHLCHLPEKLHWKVYLELADLAKRENHLRTARKYYFKVTQLQPYAAQGWLEYAKMEEECGQLEQCQAILATGLHYCPFNESLMVKGIKHEERMGNLSAARTLLSRLRTQSIDKAWRTIMEGGLLEARAGNVLVARKVFKYLIKNVPWYGPIYQEAYRFEERCEEYERAIHIVEKGLKENPRYGPLWFSALRLYEKMASTSPHYNSAPSDSSSPSPLLQTRQLVERARAAISRELTWKIYFEAAQIEERAGNLALARTAYVKSVEHCSENLLWKVWLGGSRTELNADNIDIARKLLTRSLQEVPAKMRAMVLLECSRLEEYAGHTDKARRILERARQETRYEWKVFLESVLLEMRAGNTEAAIREAKAALKIHSGTGRLWAVLIQLNQAHGKEAQSKVFQRALQQVPKSGEVWCEGARILLSSRSLLSGPTSEALSASLSRSTSALALAPPSPSSTPLPSSTTSPLSKSLDALASPADVLRRKLHEARQFLDFAVQFTPQYGDSFIEYLRLELMEHGPEADTSRLEQLCVNADPNYGTMWLHSKRHPLDSTRQVLRNAKRMLLETSSTAPPAAHESWQGRETPSDQGESGEGCWVGNTGVLSLHRTQTLTPDLSNEEKRKLIFGSDQIKP